MTKTRFVRNNLHIINDYRQGENQIKDNAD